MLVGTKHAAWHSQVVPHEIFSIGIIMTQYLVYQLIDPRDGLPFYIGFAKDPQRPYNHLKEYNRWQKGYKLKTPNYHKLGRIKDILAEGFDYTVQIVCTFDTADAAYDKEVELIAHYGRSDLGTGILTNMSAGGKGLINPNDEVREAIRAKNKRPLKEKWSQESLSNWYEIMTEKMQSEEYKNNLRVWGTKGAAHIKEKGWSIEAINQRIETRREKNNFSDMSACNTPESITKRVNTRKANGGFSIDTSACHTDDSKFKRERTKIINLIARVESHYNCKFSFSLLRVAKKDKITYVQESTLRRYLNVDEQQNYSE